MKYSEKELTTSSKFLSLVLRHSPQTIRLSLDGEGWAGIDELIQQAQKHGTRLNRELLEQVVVTSDKKRFCISDDGLRIRANQGHSIAVDLKPDPQEPPAQLFHGTATRFLDSIGEQGLLPQNRQYVHLSADVETATKVGSRHGRPTVLTVRAGSMHSQGHEFFLSQNGVWLTLAVPPSFIAPHGER